VDPLNVKLGLMVASLGQFLMVDYRKGLAVAVAESVERDCSNRQLTFKLALGVLEENPTAGHLLDLPPGHIVKKQGGILTIAECQNVTGEVTFQESQECFVHMPVVYKNTKYFREAVSKIIVSSSDLVDCQLDPSSHQLADGYFYSQSPKLVRLATQPSLLDPNFLVNNTFLDLLPYNTLGTLYGKKADLFGYALLNPVRRETFQMSIHRETEQMTGQDGAKKGPSDNKLLHMMKNMKNKLIEAYESILNTIEQTLVYSFLALCAIILFLLVCGVIKSILCKRMLSMEICKILGWSFFQFYLFFRWVCIGFRLCKPDLKDDEEEDLEAQKPKRRKIRNVIRRILRRKTATKAKKKTQTTPRNISGNMPKDGRGQIVSSFLTKKATIHTVYKHNAVSSRL
jgi:hypothetical protein